MLYKLESLKEEIKKMMESEHYDKKELVKKSQELDIYIVKYIKEKLLKSNEEGED